MPPAALPCLTCQASLRAIIIEVPQPDGPFGARGIGEHTIIPIAPIVASAVEDAIGIRLKFMPITAEKIALAIKEKELSIGNC